MKTAPTYVIDWADGMTAEVGEDGEPFKTQAQAREYAQTECLEAGPGESAVYMVREVS